MSENEKKSEKEGDSFEIPVKKSPLFMFAMLQIPLVILMIIMLYVMYQSQKGD